MNTWVAAGVPAMAVSVAASPLAVRKFANVDALLVAKRHAFAAGSRQFVLLLHVYPPSLVSTTFTRTADPSQVLALTIAVAHRRISNTGSPPTAMLFRASTPAFCVVEKPNLKLATMPVTLDESYVRLLSTTPALTGSSPPASRLPACEVPAIASAPLLKATFPLNVIPTSEPEPRLLYSCRPNPN